MTKYNRDDLRKANYELFILALTILSLFNLPLILFATNDETNQVAFTVNVMISAIFFIDFLARLHWAEARREYFTKHYGWLDLVGSVPIPGFNLARVWRVFKAGKVLGQTGSREVLRQVAANRAETALLFIGLAVIYLLEFGSILILHAEIGAPNAEITTAEDAIWWVWVTISTVGYGDLVPVTIAGRRVAVVVIFAGVGVFGTLSGYLANSFLGQRNAEANMKTEEIATPIVNELKKIHQAQVKAREQQEEENAHLKARLDNLEKLLQENRK